MISPDYEWDAAVLQKVAPVAAEMDYHLFSPALFL
jgi:hypothetical protein